MTSQYTVQLHTAWKLINISRLMQEQHLSDAQHHDKSSLSRGTPSDIGEYFGFSFKSKR